MPVSARCFLSPQVSSDRVSATRWGSGPRGSNPNASYLLPRLVTNITNTTNIPVFPQISLNLNLETIEKNIVIIPKTFPFSLSGSTRFLRIRCLVTRATVHSSALYFSSFPFGSHPCWNLENQLQSAPGVNGFGYWISRILVQSWSSLSGVNLISSWSGTAILKLRWIFCWHSSLR